MESEAQGSNRSSLKAVGYWSPLVPSAVDPGLAIPNGADSLMVGIFFFLWLEYQHVMFSSVGLLAKQRDWDYLVLFSTENRAFELAD